jgi:hypothetical protein
MLQFFIFLGDSTMHAQLFRHIQGQIGVISEDDRPKWFNSPVSFHVGTLKDIRALVPEFERRSFVLTQPGNERSRLNEVGWQ